MAQIQWDQDADGLFRVCFDESDAFAGENGYIKKLFEANGTNDRVALQTRAGEEGRRPKSYCCARQMCRV